MDEKPRVNIFITVHGSYKWDPRGISSFYTSASYKSMHIAPINYSPKGFDNIMLLNIYLCKILENIPLEMMNRLFNDSFNKIANQWFKIQYPTTTRSDLCEKLYEFFNIKYTTPYVKIKYYEYDFSYSTFPEILPSYSDDIAEREAIKLIYDLGRSGVNSYVIGTGIFVTNEFALKFVRNTAFKMNVVVEYLENTGLTFADYTRVESKAHDSIVLRYSKFQNIMQCKYYIAFSIIGSISHLMKEADKIEDIHGYIFTLLTKHLNIEEDTTSPGHKIISLKEDECSFLCYADDTTNFQIAEVRPDGELQSITEETEPFRCINTAFEGVDLNEIFDRERYGGKSKVFGLNEDEFIKPYMDRMRTCIREDAARRPPGEFCFNTLLTDMQRYSDVIEWAMMHPEEFIPDEMGDTEELNELYKYPKLKIIHSKVVATLVNTTNEELISFFESSTYENGIMIFDESCAYVHNLPQNIAPDTIFPFDPSIARGKTRKKNKKKNKTKKRKSRKNKKDRYIV